MVFFELRDRLNKYFAFSKKEVRDLAAAVLIVGFIFSFRDWGDTAFDALVGIKNLILAVFASAISFFVHESAHRIMALKDGFKAEFKIWWGGLIVSLMLAFASNGRIQLVLPGGIVVALLARYRLGIFRYGWSYWDMGIIAIWGPLANIALAFIAKLFVETFPASYFFQKLFIINIVFGICTILPIPHLDGINTFFGGRLLYVLILAGVIVASVLLLLPKVLSVFMALIIGLVITALILAVYYFTIEHQPQ